MITNSSLRYNIESSWGGSAGSGNVVRGNCIGGGTDDEDDGGILSAPNRGSPTATRSPSPSSSTGPPAICHWSLAASATRS